jgi:ParB-like chromosome segregation protein Spo0J
MKQHKQMMMKVSDLKNLEKNARRHSPAQLQQIEESIKKFGFLSPIVIDKNNVVQAGNGRLMAATKLGMTEVPCIQANGLSKDELRAFALVDNRLSETSEWDKDILKLELEDLTLNLDFDLGPIGFSSEEIEKMLGVFESVEEKEMPDLDNNERKPVQQMAFSLSHEQAEVVREAIEYAKSLGDFGETGNPNQNGNALWRICELCLSVQKI